MSRHAVRFVKDVMHRQQLDDIEGITVIETSVCNKIVVCRCKVSVNVSEVVGCVLFEARSFPGVRITLQHHTSTSTSSSNALD